MNKKGFTLIELLAVIAIIAILSILVVPNVISVNNNVNKRMQSEKAEMILTAAELYVADGKVTSKVSGTDYYRILVGDLVVNNYIEADVENGDGIDNFDASGNAIVENCTDSYGCVNALYVDSTTGEEKYAHNDTYVYVYSKSVGYVATFEDPSSVNSSSSSFVSKVCDGFGTSYDGLSLTETDSTGKAKYCRCKGTTGAYTGIVTFQKDADGNETNVTDSSNACILVSNNSSGTINNWVKYESSDANWRVLGIYYVDSKLSVKMITSNVVE